MSDEIPKHLAPRDVSSLWPSARGKDPARTIVPPSDPGATSHWPPLVRRTPVVGDLRVLSDGNPLDTVIEVLSETGWLRLNGVEKLHLWMESKEFNRVVLTLVPAYIEFNFREEQVFLRRYKEIPDESPTGVEPAGENRPGADDAGSR